MDNKNGAGLRVTLVLPQKTIPNWLSNIVSALFESNFLDLSVVVLANQRCPYTSGPAFFRRWKALDHRFFRQKLQDAQQSEVLTELDIGRFGGRVCQHNGLTAVDLSREVGKSDPDTVVWLAFDRPPPELLGMPKFGVWTLSNAANMSVGFRELVRRDPVTACTLIRYGACPEDDRVLASTFAATDQLSLARGLIGIRAKDQTLLMSMLNRVHRSVKLPSTDRAPDKLTQSGPVAPSALQLLSGLARLYGRYVIGLAKRPFYFNQWQLAYRLGGDRLSQNGMKRLAPEHKGFWADPFVVKRNGCTALFFEELPEGESRGKILVAKIHDDGHVGEPTTVIETNHHLSYPFLFEFEGELFMTPESAESGRVEAYRCVEFPCKWEPYSVLIDGVHAYDPTLVEYEDRWWMFATIQRNGNSCSDELNLFYASTPFGEWTPHPLNPIGIDVRSARPAGALYWDEGQLFRPAQDCSVRYGYALSIQKITRMTTREYEEEEVSRITPEWAADSWGTHTINHSDGITVYDCLARCRK